MRIGESLSHWLTPEWESWFLDFAQKEKLLREDEDFRNDRFLRRSVIPHIRNLSELFNRKAEASPSDGYWSSSSNSPNLWLSYFLSFQLFNMTRVASIWEELHRLGYDREKRPIRRILELGAGLSAGASGILLGERHGPNGLDGSVRIATIEAQRSVSRLGQKWLESFGPWLGAPDLAIDAFVRRLTPQELLPPKAPKFDVILSSYFMNESLESPQVWARAIHGLIEHHLEEEGLFILCEPALQEQSRKVLEVRQELLKLWDKKPLAKILTPCLGHQACGALAKEGDWCHEETSWWRPQWLKLMDQELKLDHRTLPFSYLVLAKSQRSLGAILPKVGSQVPYRLVSPPHKVGRGCEFYVCCHLGKSKTRSKVKLDVERGDVLLDLSIEQKSDRWQILN